VEISSLARGSVAVGVAAEAADRIATAARIPSSFVMDSNVNGVGGTSPSVV